MVGNNNNRRKTYLSHDEHKASLNCIIIYLYVSTSPSHGTKPTMMFDLILNSHICLCTSFHNILSWNCGMYTYSCKYFQGETHFHRKLSKLEFFRSAVLAQRTDSIIVTVMAYKKLWEIREMYRLEKWNGYNVARTSSGGIQERK